MLYVYIITLWANKDIYTIPYLHAHFASNFPQLYCHDSSKVRVNIDLIWHESWTYKIISCKLKRYLVTSGTLLCFSIPCSYTELLAYLVTKDNTSIPQMKITHLFNLNIYQRERLLWNLKSGKKLVENRHKIKYFIHKWLFSLKLEMIWNMDTHFILNGLPV